MNIEFHPLARRELETAIDDYRAISDELARCFTEEVDAAVADVATHPDRWAFYEPLAEFARWRRRLMAGFPYLLICEVTGGAVRIVAAPHTARRPGYWLDRA